MAAEDNLVRAPFTLDQLRSLNAYQQCGVVHEFTCRDRGTPEHLGTDGVLVALPDGWLCPWCGYRQDWAHQGMADWSWKKLTVGLRI